MSVSVTSILRLRARNRRAKFSPRRTSRVLNEVSGCRSSVGLSTRMPWRHCAERLSHRCVRSPQPRQPHPVQMLNKMLVKQRIRPRVALPVRAGFRLLRWSSGPSFRSCRAAQVFAINRLWRKAAALRWTAILHLHATAPSGAVAGSEQHGRTRRLRHGTQRSAVRRPPSGRCSPFCRSGRTRGWRQNDGDRLGARAQGQS